MQLTCVDCRHSRPVIADNDRDPLLKCYRYPPQLVVLDSEVTQVLLDANEPCGEWSP